MALNFTLRWLPNRWPSTSLHNKQANVATTKRYDPDTASMTHGLDIYLQTAQGCFCGCFYCIQEQSASKPDTHRMEYCIHQCAHMREQPENFAQSSYMQRCSVLQLLRTNPNANSINPQLDMRQ